MIMTKKRKGGQYKITMNVATTEEILRDSMPLNLKIYDIISSRDGKECDPSNVGLGVTQSTEPAGG